MFYYRVFSVLSFVFPLLSWGQHVTPIFQTGHFSKVSKVRFHSNNQNLISAGDDGKLLVWDINLGLQRAEVLAHENGVLDFDFLNDTTLVSLGGNNQFKTWSFPNLELMRTFHVNMDSIQAFAVTSNSICMVGKWVYFYDLMSKQCRTASYKSKGLFTTVEWHAERNEILVAGPKDNYAVAIDLKDPILFKQYFIGNMHAARYADSLILLATNNGALHYQNACGAKTRVFSLSDDLNYVVDMDAAENTIALGSAFGFTTIFDAQNRKVLNNIGLSGTAISSLSYSDDGKWLATANTKGSIYIYDTENYNINKILKGASASIIDLKVFADQMIIGYSDGIIRYLNLPTNQIKSNSIKLNQTQEQAGVNYAVLSIDTIVNGTVKFHVLKTDRHHINTSLLSAASIIKAEWDLFNNQITLKQSRTSRALKNKIQKDFNQNIPFQFSSFNTENMHYQLGANRFQINSDKYAFYKISKHDTVFYQVKHTAPITGLRFLPSYQLILSFSNDGSIRFWNEKGDYLAVLYLSGQYNFFYQNANNFYFASKEILNKIGFIYNKKLFAYEQYDIYYNRPSEVMKNLPYFERQDISDYQKAYFKLK